MTIATAAETSSSSALVRDAMRQNKTMSRDGILEHIFAFAFRGLVYPQIWEDPEVDMAAMELTPDHHVMAIASGGCNVMSYLTAKPRRITAVDLNAAHVALNRLKLTGLKHATDWQQFYSFFGEANKPDNIKIYNQVFRPHLDEVSKAYWDRRNILGQPRINLFKNNIYSKGLLGRFMQLGHFIGKLYGRDLRKLTACKTLEDQRNFFDHEVAPLLEKPIIKFITDQKMSLYGLGIPPAQYDALAEGQRMSVVLHQRLERLTCAFPLSENYFTWQAYGASYAPDAAGPLPPYLQESNFKSLQALADCVEVKQISFTECLNEMKPHSVDRFVLLDAQDWMNDDQLNDLWRAIWRAATPKARVIFRTAGSQTILPGRIEAAALSSWTYLDALSQKLGAKDRSSIYGGFHIYERAN